MSGVEANRPIRDRYLDRSRQRSRPASARILLPAAINIRPSITRILKDIKDACTIWRTPDDLVWSWSKQRPNRQGQSIPVQVTHHTARALQFPEFGKHQMKTGPHLLIRIENNCARSIVGEPGRQRQPQFAARRLLAFPLVQAHPKLMQLRLAHDAGQAQQQAVVVGARIVKPLAIRMSTPNTEHSSRS